MPYFDSKDASIPLSEEQLKRILKRYDKNGDGKLSRKELKLAFKEMGLRFCGWKTSRAFRHADKNEDGYIDEEEMNELVRYASRCSNILENHYKEILEEFMLNQPIDENGNPVGPTMEQIDEMWIQASGGIVKGRVYSFGSKSNFSRQISGLSGSSSSSLSYVNKEEIEMMRRKVKELTEKWSREKAKRKRVERDVRGLKAQVKNILASGRFPIPASPSIDASSSDDSDFEGNDSEGI